MIPGRELCDWNAALVPGAAQLLRAQTPGQSLTGSGNDEGE